MGLDTMIVSCERGTGNLFGRFVNVHVSSLSFTEMGARRGVVVFVVGRHVYRWWGV